MKMLSESGGNASSSASDDWKSSSLTKPSWLPLGLLLLRPPGAMTPKASKGKHESSMCPKKCCVEALQPDSCKVCVVY